MSFLFVRPVLGGAVLCYYPLLYCIIYWDDIIMKVSKRTKAVFYIKTSERYTQSNLLRMYIKRTLIESDKILYIENYNQHFYNFKLFCDQSLTNVVFVSKLVPYFRLRTNHLCS